MSYNTITVADTATQIVAANTQRHSLGIFNNGSQTVYIGPDSSVTTSNGFPIQEGSTWTEDSGGTKLYTGPWYGIVASSTADVRYWERTI